jgi:hypothetical protein
MPPEVEILEKIDKFFSTFFVKDELGNFTVRVDSPGVVLDDVFGNFCPSSITCVSEERLPNVRENGKTIERYSAKYNVHPFIRCGRNFMYGSDR